MIYRPGQPNLNASNPALDIYLPDQPWWLVGGISPPACVLAYQPIKAASLAESYINVANPGTYNAAPGVAPTLSAGWVFNGTTQYLDSGLNPGQTTTWSCIARFNATTTTVHRSILGLGGTGMQNFGLFSAISGVNKRWVQTNYYNPSGVASGAHVMSFTGNSAYYDGTFVGTMSTTLAAGTTENIYIGASNDVSAAAANFFAGTIQAVAIYNVTITGAQMAALTTAINAL